MRTITRLPSRPLRRRDVAALDDDRFQVSTYGGIVEEAEIRIYAIKIAAGDTASALCFDDSREQWKHLASVDAGDLAAADEQLDAAIDDWVQDNYGGRFEVLKPR
jgi:hypothetical protein